MVSSNSPIRADSNKIENTKAINECLNLMCSTRWFQFATFHLVTMQFGEVEAPFIKTTYPDAWVSYYLQHHLIATDPIVRRALEDKGSFLWSSVVKSHAETRMMKKALEFGIPSIGFTALTAENAPWKGFFSLTMAPEFEDVFAWEDFVVRHQQDLEAIASQLYFKAAQELDPQETFEIKLSKREMECLQFIARGKSHSDIGDILGLSEHTVRSYSRSVRQKLNCSTLAQAVAKASAIGLI